MEENPEIIEKEMVVKEELNSLIEQEDLHWSQQAKENWLRYGDQNSKYFHACASQKNCRKYIEKIKDKRGRLCQSKEDIESAFIQYYDDLFTAGNEIDMEPCLNAMDCKVSP
jgi:hypothetical protein